MTISKRQLIGMLPDENPVEFLRRRVRFADGSSICPKDLYSGYPEMIRVIATAVDLKEWSGRTGMIEGPMSDWPWWFYHLVQHARGTQNALENQRVEKMEKEAKREKEAADKTVVLEGSGR